LTSPMINIGSRSTLEVWAGVVVLGGVGAVLRFVVDGAVGARVGRSFPYGTLVVNLSGAFVLGLLAGLALSRNVALLAGTATVGAYTTFSTWMFETQRLGEDSQVRYLLGNLGISLVAGLGAAALGRWVGTLL
jgi:fluoride exporter